MEVIKLIYLYIGAGGFFGAIARYALGQAIGHLWTGSYPLGTFLINLAGCFFLGVFLTLSLEWLPVEPHVRLGVATGFIGALTTFSTYAYEALGLLDRGLMGQAIVYVVLSVALGLFAVWLGIAAARVIMLLPTRAASSGAGSTAK